MQPLAVFFGIAGRHGIADIMASSSPPFFFIILLPYSSSAIFSSVSYVVYVRDGSDGSEVSGSFVQAGVIVIPIRVKA